MSREWHFECQACSEWGGIAYDAEEMVEADNAFDDHEALVHPDGAFYEFQLVRRAFDNRTSPSPSRNPRKI